jgi:hypothetical protein
MIGFEGRHQWRQHQLFKPRANLSRRKIYMFFNILQQSPKFFAAVNPHAKVAIRLFLEW